MAEARRHSLDIAWVRTDDGTDPDVIAMEGVPVGELPEGFVYCETYWGSHGCHIERGHDGDCECDCCECENHPDPDSGCVAKPPYYGPETRFYGDGAERLGLPRD